MKKRYSASAMIMEMRMQSCCMCSSCRALFSDLFSVSRVNR